jgi:hypothetical protein
MSDGTGRRRLSFVGTNFLSIWSPLICRNNDEKFEYNSIALWNSGFPRKNFRNDRPLESYLEPVLLGRISHLLQDISFR